MYVDLCTCYRPVPRPRPRQAGPALALCPDLTLGASLSGLVLCGVPPSVLFSSAPRRLPHLCPPGTHLRPFHFRTPSLKRQSKSPVVPVVPAAFVLTSSSCQACVVRSDDAFMTFLFCVDL